MKPIGQTFYVNAPASGASGVYITRVDLFFASVSTTHGVELQIRETSDGIPTQAVVPFGRCQLQVDDAHANSAPKIVASSDASEPTIFEFETPVWVNANKLYGLAVAPAGGVPDYEIWTAEIGQTDVLYNTPVFTNHSAGDLFLSSNDRSWTPIIYEDIKYKIYYANFTSSDGYVYLKSRGEDWVKFENPTGTFRNRETILFGNEPTTKTVLSVTSMSGSFNSGDVVTQGDVGGTIYFANSTVIKLTDANGAFSNTTVTDANTSATATVVSALQSVVTTAGSNTITVPDSSVFATNTVIYVTQSDGANTQVNRITSKPTSTTLTLANTAQFSDSAAVIGTVVANGAFLASYVGTTNSRNFYYGVLDNITANTSTNLVDLTGLKMIGSATKVSADIVEVRDVKYNSITTSLAPFEPANTAVDLSLKGFASNSTFGEDTSWQSIDDGVPNEFFDYTRVHMSRSRELTELPAPRLGNNSVTVRVSISTENSKVSPAIDVARSDVQYTYNIVAPSEALLSGYYLSINSASGSLSVGDTITQTSYGNTTTGIVSDANSTQVIVNYVNGKFVSDAAFSATGGITGEINTATEFSEPLSNGPTGTYGLTRASRYVSKSVILDDGQDAEDLISYTGAYRPAGTDMLVYTKVLNASDTEKFSAKHWTRMVEGSSYNLFSSKVNYEDLVELVHGLPTSVLAFGNTVTTKSSSNSVIVPTTAGISNGDIVYLQSDNSARTFNVRRVVYVTNSTALMLESAPSFTSTNAALGTIPGAESAQGAFKFDQNDGIVRYVTKAGAVFDGYKQFAFKLVPIASNPAVSPRAADFRAIALQV